MAWQTVHKTEQPDRPAPNLADYEKARREFSKDNARAALTGLPDGGLNIAFEALDRHLADGLADKTAIRWMGKDRSARDISFRELAAETSRFAHLLERLGVGPGERVFSLLGRVPALYVAALGTLKAGRVFSPLFSAFGPEPVRSRMEIGDARVLVTTRNHYQRKVAPWRKDLPGLAHVLLTDAEGSDLPEGTRSLAEALTDCPDHGGLAATRPEDMALVHFTSGTTGRPKGAIHVHEAVIWHRLTGALALDLHPDDIYWCTADPGWVTGTSYGIIGPWANGVTQAVLDAGFNSEAWYRFIAKHRITVWYSAPTAIRLLMRDGTELAQQHDLSSLRHLCSVGEPLNAEAVIWSEEAYGKPFHDTFWQTETGCMVITNWPGMKVKPGSMGKPFPGINAAIVDPATGEQITEPGKVGIIALEPGWPSMIRGYRNNEEGWRKKFRGGWYLCGDQGSVDQDGYFWFSGRDDDVINTGGHLVGPFEIESALLEHPAVAESAAVATPDKVNMEVVKAFVVLKPGFEPSDDLDLEIMNFIRKKLSPLAMPQQIEFIAQLPKTRSGKIIRRILRAQEFGEDLGDVSTLMNDDD